MSERTENRIKALEAMDTIIMQTGDEDLYDIWWTYGVPNEAKKSDYRYIANIDKEYYEVEELFMALMDKIHYWKIL